jgi:hypothetical protein
MANATDVIDNALVTAKSSTESAINSVFGTSINLYKVGMTATSSENFSAATNTFGAVWKNMSENWQYTSGNWSLLGGSNWGVLGKGLLTVLQNTVATFGLALGEGIGTISAGFSEAMSVASDIDNKFGSIEKWIDQTGYAFLSGGQSTIAGVMGTIAENIGNDSAILGVISRGLTIFTDALAAGYVNGVSETSFGGLLENSWSKGANSFLSTFMTGSSKYTVHVLPSTPLDPGANSQNLYGTMLLGTPPVFNNISDPKNRSIMTTFLRDAKFLSLTPGYPQYNGSIYLQAKNKDQLHMTQTGEAMMEYLLSNGIDSNFAKKDKRYYTFKSNYEDYYSYLEAMLNPIWIKMGLATVNNTEFNIFSFFKITDSTTGKITTSEGSLIDRYRSPLGFFVNPSNALTESINSTPTSYGNENMGVVNNASDEYQRINYITGMGTGGNVRNAVRTATTVLGVGRNLSSFLGDTLSGTISGINSFKTDGILLGALKTASGALSDTQRFFTEKDNGAVMQSFATTNGMKVVYPELWQDSSYMKSININFEFISPYGDPESIFKYVMVPFCSLLCFAMPRQAADNGYVSPFFIRADIPGYFTSDLGMITDFTWTKGGESNLWTKDGLPRSISGSFTI